MPDRKRNANDADPAQTEAGPMSGNAAVRDRLRQLPSVASIVVRLMERGTPFAEDVLVRLVRDAIEQERQAILSADPAEASDVVERIERIVHELARPRLRPALNATGVIIHTNLGRAPVSAETAEAMRAAAANAVSLELEPETNERGGRMREISLLMQALTGAEASLVVNNGAAAVLLALSAVASGKEVVVSRGEAIEIGGGFRIPDVMRQSGALLVEVGSTNRTYGRDYAGATTERTGAYLKVHPSNFRTLGFVHSVSTGELATLGHERGVPVLEDLGSGALFDTGRFGLAPEPTIGDTIDAGADLVTASGDKLLGGPQAGLIVGKRELVGAAARHPLARAVRADKTCLAGIAATLRHYARGEATEVVPVWRMIAARADDLRLRGERLRELLGSAGVTAGLEPTAATVGGGALPGQSLPSWALVLDSGPDEAVDALAQRLRTGQAPVFGRIDRDRLVCDLRTVLPEDDQHLAQGILLATAGRCGH